MSIRHYLSSVFYNGQPLTGVSVQVFLAGTSTLATLYSDVAGLTPLANPFTNDATYGTVSLYAEEGTYDIVLTKTGYTFPAMQNILIGAPGYLTNIVDVPTVNGASVLTATGAIPAGASDVKVFKLNTLGFGNTGGLTGIHVGDAASVDRWGNATALTQNDQTDQTDFRTYDPGIVYTAAAAVLLSAVGGVFDATGQARLVVKYRMDTAAG